MRRILNVNNVLAGVPEDESREVRLQRMAQAVARNSLPVETPQRMDHIRKQAPRISDVFQSGAWLPVATDGQDC